LIIIGFSGNMRRLEAIMFKIDLHVHTTLGGDSLIEPDQLVARAREVGLDAVCVTEHNSYALSRPLEGIRRKTGFPILRGMEYNAAEGHLLIFGVKAGRGNLPPRLPIQSALDWVNRSPQGVAIPAHPYQRDMLGRSLGRNVMNLKGLIAIETINGSLSSRANQKAMDAADKLAVHGIGGSDAHGLQVLGRVYTLFPLPVKSEEELVTALKKGGYTPRWNDYYTGEQ
jgi:predicted metal-dependent phosphoesterase TrpH